MNRTTHARTAAGLATATLLLVPLALGCERREPPVTTPPAPSTPADTNDGMSPDRPAPDNTGINERDRSDAAVTPGDQSESADDRATTQRIRQAVLAEEGLSLNADNVKIVTRNGMVTLRGPVDSAAERTRIDAIARQIAGDGNVDNQLEVAPD